MEKGGLHVVSGGSQQQPSHSLPPIKETDDDNTASDDMEMKVITYKKRCARRQIQKR